MAPRPGSQAYLQSPRHSLMRDGVMVLLYQCRSRFSGSPNSDGPLSVLVLISQKDTANMTISTLTDITLTASSLCNVLAVTIVASQGRSELAVTVDHTPEETMTADGETRTISSRTFRSRVAQPAVAGRLMFEGTRNLHPAAIVNLVYA